MSGASDAWSDDGGPLISVVVPTYRRPALTRAAIDSVVSSAPHEVEVIVVEDGDDACAVTLPSRNRAGIAVISVRLAENEGPGRARALGVARARGRYVAFLDSDDRLAEPWIDHCRQWIGSLDPQVRGVLMGRLREETVVTKLALDLIGAGPANVRLAVARIVAMFFNPFHTTGLLLHRDLARFHPWLRHCEDYYTVLASVFAADRVDVAHLYCGTLGHVPGTSGGVSSDRGNMFMGELVVRFHALRTPQVPVRYRALVPVGLAYQLLRGGLKRMLGQAPSRRLM